MSTFNTQLAKVSQFVLEDWAMMLIEPNSEGFSSFNNGEQIYCAEIVFSGEENIKGKVAVISQYSFMQILCTNILGMSEEVISEEQAKDCIMEMANVVAGNFVTEVWGEDNMFILSPPTIDNLDFVQLDELSTKSNVNFIADDETVIILFEEEKL